MKKELLPAFARQYKTKGYDVRLVGKSYQLFRITSKRVPGKSYPVLQQTYIGTIDPVKGLIPKKVVPESSRQQEVEFGLSNFIIKHFKRSLMRSVFNSTCTQVYMGIVYYLYGSAEERFVNLTYVRRYLADVPKISGANALKRLQNMAGLIDEHLCSLIPNRDDRLYIIARLREIRVGSDEDKPQPCCPDDLMQLIKTYTNKDASDE